MKYVNSARRIKTNPKFANAIQVKRKKKGRNGKIKKTIVYIVPGSRRRTISQ